MTSFFLLLPNVKVLSPAGRNTKEGLNDEQTP